MALTAETYLTAEGSATLVFGFLRAEGVPAPVVREYREVRRPGVNNLGHYLGGLVGQKFQLRTFCDAANKTAAKTLQASYKAAEGSRMDLYWQQVLVGTVFIYEAAPQLVQVFDSSAGGFSGGLAIAETVWTMRGLA